MKKSTLFSALTTFSLLAPLAFGADGDPETAAKILHRLAKDESYAIIFIVENYAKVISEDIARYKDSPLPAVISIPGRAGSDGSGMAAIKSAVERAVGADILFKD